MCLLWFWPPILTMSSIQEDMQDLWEGELLQSKGRRGAVNKIEQEIINENYNDMVNINLLRSYRKG